MRVSEIKSDGVTFRIGDVVTEIDSKEVTLKEFMTTIKKGRILRTTESDGMLIPLLGNGFVGAAFEAYSKHHHLVISPDDLWIAITTSLSSEINRNAEKMRHLFVDHDGKKEITVYGDGTILTADYDKLTDLISKEIALNTKADIREWIECGFSTTTPLIRTVSQIVLMGSMKNYFDYKIYLECGLNQVTLKGRVEDYLKILERVERLKTFGVENLAKWSEVLIYVLNKFVDAFNNDKMVDVDFWNSIINYNPGGSGSPYLCGWILSFVPFDKNGEYVLKSLESIKKDGKYGYLDTDSVPTSTAEVLVKIIDNGIEYNTIFYGGIILAKKINPWTISPSIDWALVDVTE